ncbi:unnamed protein product, partial [marine sediment metagenome]
AAMKLAQAKIHKLHPVDWILILDADIILPNGFKNFINHQNLSSVFLYSCLRKDYYCYDDYLKQANAKTYRFSYKYAGYFQLYYDKNLLYSDQYTYAAGADILFAKYFDFKKMLQITVYHLGKPEVNWYGRVSEKWDKSSSVATSNILEILRKQLQERQIKKNKMKESQDKNKQIKNKQIQDKKIENTCKQEVSYQAVNASKPMASSICHFDTSEPKPIKKIIQKRGLTHQPCNCGRENRGLCPKHIVPKKFYQPPQIKREPIYQ